MLPKNLSKTGLIYDLRTQHPEESIYTNLITETIFIKKIWAK